MKALSLVVTFFLVGCGAGPDLSAVVDTYSTGGLTFESEVPFARGEQARGRVATAWVDASVVSVRRVLEDSGLVKPGEFPTRFAGVPILIRATDDLEPATAAKTVGLHRARVGVEWIELLPDGMALGHELLHALGERHDSRGRWERAGMADVEAELDAYALNWTL